MTHQNPTINIGIGKSELSGKYPAAQRETLAEAPGLRVRLLTLFDGQTVPWHYHRNTTDTFFCMRGPMRVKTREPDATHVLNNGDTLAVKPGIPHHVEGASDGPCQFMIVQGVGKYDYVAVAE